MITPLKVKSSVQPLKIGSSLDGFSNVGGDFSVKNLVKPTVDLGIGAVKGAANTLQNIGNLAVKPLDFISKKITGSAPTTGISKEALAPSNTTQKVGKFAEQVGEFALPSSQIGKFSKAEGFLNKTINLGTRALTSGAVATAQEGKVGKGTGIAAGTELVLPGVEAVAKPVMNVVSRLFKGLGSGLSGVGTGSIENIIKNPEVAQKVSKDIVANGQEHILEENAKTIVNGISGIKKQAGEAFRKGLDSLSKVDINPENIKNGLMNALEKNKVSLTKDAEGVVGLDLGNADFIDESIKQRATNLVDKVNNYDDFSGTGVRKLMDVIENSKFKSAPDGDRQAFNALAGDMVSGLRDAVSKSTKVMGDINAKYSKDLQIAENMERIFGDIQYKNISEIGGVAKKLESLFSQKGLDPKEIDAFLTRIGVSPDEFKTSESVRQIMNKTSGANTKGLSPTEIIQQVTSAVVTPTTIKNVAVLTGLTEQVLKPILEKLAPAARGALIKSLMDVGNQF